MCHFPTQERTGVSEGVTAQYFSDQRQVFEDRKWMKVVEQAQKGSHCTGNFGCQGPDLHCFSAIYHSLNSDVKLISSISDEYRREFKR